MGEHVERQAGGCSGVVDMLRNLRCTLMLIHNGFCGKLSPQSLSVFPGLRSIGPVTPAGANSSVGLISSSLAFFRRRLLRRIAQLTPPSHIKNFLDTPKPLRLICEIADEPRVKEGKTTSLVHVRSIVSERDSFSTGGDALLTIIQDNRSKEKVKAFRYGSIISLEAELNTPIVSRNPGEFSYREYLELNNVFATVHVLGYSRVHLLSEGTPISFLNMRSSRRSIYSSRYQRVRCRR